MLQSLDSALPLKRSGMAQRLPPVMVESEVAVEQLTTAGLLRTVQSNAVESSHWPTAHATALEQCKRGQRRRDRR